jgi:branched-chain amino acid aminotransferase
MSRIVYVAGEWLAAEAATVPITDRGFLMGDGVYDTCRVFQGQYFRFEQHAERLRVSGQVLRIDVPPVPELWRIAQDLLTRNRDAAGPERGALDHAVLRLTVTRGSGGKGLGTSGAGPVRVVATLRPLPADWRQRARAGWSVMTAATRHAPAQVIPSALKGQGRIYSLLARLEAEEAGCDDALLLSTDGRITEGTTWNVFWRHGRTLRTPAANEGLLPGVTRAMVMELAASAGYTIEEGGWPRSEIEGAHEAFATMTSLGVVPIRSLDGRDFPATGEAAGPLGEQYWERVAEETRG